MFVKGLLDVVEQHYPVRTRRIRQAEYPWMSPSIKKKIRTRNAAYRRLIFSRGRTYPSIKADFMLRKREVERMIGHGKMEFFQRNASNSRKIWAVLGRLLKKDHQVKTPSQLDANAINLHYVQMGQHGVPHPPAARPEPLSVNPCVFQFSEVKVEEVLEILREITTARKSKGPSGIPPKLLGIVALPIAEPIAHLVNASLRSGVYPDLFKIAHITPISKSTDASKPDDFRPIALINNASKVFEKVVQSRLLEHLQRYSTLSSRQLGFRAGH
ncbi:hypothetical protein BV898_11095 [Hypsibius exemplaris]|uniref:Reverse transcriptase domain-containing protein n=1 Tax=Hypsibius exemplaris TaxID=2072580 RepID=A0A1W0WHX1_HYPEX|nr:hypothetical protein BV898_11095 [Hypsibius exemplaris]